MLRLFRLALWLLVLIAPATAFAQAPAPRLLVRVDVGSSGLDAAEVRDAIATELGAPVASEPAEATVDRLDVRVGEDAITIVYAEHGQKELKRVVERPKDRSKDLEVIAWLAGNLARDEARDLAAELGPKPPPPPPPAPPPPPRRKPAARAKPMERAYFNLSLFHPIALYRDSHLRLVNAELGLVYGRLGRLRGIALDAGVTRTDRSAQGVVLSGIWRWSNGPDDGAFVSGVFSTSGGDLGGAESAGVFNLRRGDVQGAQLSGVFNIAEQLDGVQATGALNRATGMRGAQVGVVNLSRKSIGGQVGIVNYSADFDGAQAGLVNIAGRVRGVQIGLVSIADRVDGLSLSPVSIVSENRTQAALWWDTLIEANAAVKYRSGPLYSIFSFGVRPAPENERSTAFGVGIGAALWNPKPVFIDADLLYRYRVPETIRPDFQDAHSTVLRAVAGIELAPSIAVFVTGGAEFRVDDQYRGLPYLGAGLQFF